MRTARLSVSPDDSADDAPDGPDPGPPGHNPGPPGHNPEPPGHNPGPPGHNPGPPGPARPQPGDAGPRGYLDQPVGEFLSELSAGQAAPGGGSAAALTVALGASLCAMAVRLSARQLSGPDIEFLVAEAERLRGSAASLVQADAESYRGVVAALRDQPGQDPGAAGHLAGPDAGHQRARIDAALSEAATIPMEVLELAAQTARLAARLAADGNPRLRGDAITAALLAEAGARAAAVLVSINLAMLPGDDRPARAETLVAEVTRAVQAARG
jgi:methenyltetrahydrofolate cyclohydrolase